MKATKRAVWLLAITTALGAPASSLAQENPSPEQLKKMYDEAVAQLKVAQERKNQLAAENEKLGQQIAGLKSELAATGSKLDELRKSDAEHAEKTLYLRAHYTAWQQFIRQSPDIEAKWRLYLGNDFLAAPRDPWELVDRRWPLGFQAVAATAATQPATTQPATQPSTQPIATQPASQPVPMPTTVPSSTQPTATQPATSQPTSGSASALPTPP